MWFSLILFVLHDIGTHFSFVSCVLIVLIFCLVLFLVRSGNALRCGRVCAVLVHTSTFVCRASYPSLCLFTTTTNARIGLYFFFLPDCSFSFWGQDKGTACAIAISISVQAVCRVRRLGGGEWRRHCRHNTAVGHHPFVRFVGFAGEGGVSLSSSAWPVVLRLFLPFFFLSCRLSFVVFCSPCRVTAMAITITNTHCQNKSGHDDDNDHDKCQRQRQ